MKKFIFIICLAFLCSCSEHKPKVEYSPKFKNGDIVYLKLDSTKCIVEEVVAITSEKTIYLVKYKDNMGEFHTLIENENSLIE